MMRFIDSNVFIYHLAGDEQYGNIAGQIIDRIEREEEAVTSTLVISQVIGYLKWRKKLQAVPLFIDFLRSTPTINKIETTFLDIASAQKIQEKSGIGWERWDDITIAAQMLRIGIKEIYSNDSDFDAIPNIKRIFG